MPCVAGGAGSGSAAFGSDKLTIPVRLLAQTCAWMRTISADTCLGKISLPQLGFDADQLLPKASPSALFCSMLVSSFKVASYLVQSTSGEPLMQSSFSVMDTSATTAPVSSLHMTDDDELRLVLVRQTLTRATQGRLIRLKALVQALTNGQEMLTDELSDALLCSHSAVRKYVRELQSIGVVEIARYEPHGAIVSGRPVYRLGSDKQRIMAIISWSVTERQKQSKHQRSTAFTDICSGRVHILEDDLPQNYSPSKIKYCRDPLVAALFGEASHTRCIMSKPSALSKI